MRVYYTYCMRREGIENRSVSLVFRVCEECIHMSWEFESFGTRRLKFRRVTSSISRRERGPSVVRLLYERFSLQEFDSSVQEG